MRVRAIHAAITAVALLVPLASVAAAATAQAAATTTPPFNECPAVGQDPSCELLLVVNPNSTINVLGDPALGPYDGADDTLIGIVNNSAKPVPAITVTGPGSGLSELDGDGLCTYSVSGCPFGPTGYEGAGTSITTDPSLPDSAEVDFAGTGLKPGATAYFSLEGALTAATITSRTGKLHCDPVLFLGARGSGETGPGSTDGWDTKKDPTGFGPEVGQVFSQLNSSIGAGKIQAEPLSYAADPVPGFAGLRHLNVITYFNDLSAGVTQAMQDLQSDAKSCPDQKIVLAGFSQGAMVMHRILHQADQSIFTRVVAAVLIGDGDQVPFDHEVMDGSALHIAFGIGQVIKPLSSTSGAKFDSSLGARVIRVCNMSDVVCDFGTVAGLALLHGGLAALSAAEYAHGLLVHLSYPGSRALQQAAQQAANAARQ